jgi:hypothetical protein
MLGWPCISNYMNNNQLDALFTFSLLSYHSSTCFSHISSPSSGGRMYICGKWYLLYCWVDCHGPGQACWQSTQKYNKYHLPHIYIPPPDDGLLIHLKHVQVRLLNKQKINSTPSRLLFIHLLNVCKHPDKKHKYLNLINISPPLKKPSSHYSLFTVHWYTMLRLIPLFTNPPR